VTRPSDIAPWAGAFGVSVAVHGALAATLALAPRPQRVEPPATNIAIQSLAPDMPGRVAATPVPQAETKRELVENVSAPDAAARVDGGEVVTPSAATGESVTGAESTAAIEPVRDSGIMPTVEQKPVTIAGAETTEAALQPTLEAKQVSAAEVEKALAGTPRPMDEAPAAEMARVEVAAPRIAVPALEPDSAPSVAAQPVLTSDVPASQNLAPPAEVVTAPSATGITQPLAAIVPPSEIANRDVAAPSERNQIAAVEPTPSTAAGARSAPVPESTDAEPAMAISKPSPLPAVQIPTPKVDAVAVVPEPETSETQVAMLPVRPPRPVMEARPLADPLEQVRNVIAGQPEAGCFLALALPSPQIIEVDGYSETPARLQRLHNDLAAIADASVRTRQHRITPAQCEALSFARSVSPDPVAQLPITSDSAEISSGAELSGAIHNFSRKWLYLVVVDDEGTVQELHDISRNADGTIGFRAPLTLTDGPVDTVQLLLAIASDSALETFAQREGENARPYFAALASEISALRQGVEVGIAGFVIR
jgi:hypothetical protein